MSGKASGSQPANGEAKQRSHHDGSAGRAYTTEQKAAVIRIKRCAPTAYYEILGLESVKATCSDSDIKKAYRKLSLLTHPDKNGYEGADEAFKLISKAFQVLSDPEKKKKFDQFGGDPDARFNPASAGGGGSPFGNGFGGRQGGPMFQEEMTPEELFRQFFGGGFGGGPFGGFETGPGFVFNLGGGPGVRVHQFGGGRPRRRPATAHHPDSEGQSASSAFANLLPLLFLFILPLLSSLFSGSPTTATGPSLAFETPRPPQTLQRVSSRLGIHYFVNPSDVQEFSTKKWRKLDDTAETQYLQTLNARCRNEQYAQRKAMEDAQGWFGVDAVAMDAARKMELRNCQKLQKLNIRV
ncbi:hypothetical protein IAQ61_000430 [Plenodomus lingam]|uniref:uncharacterized protein n=1 Tax=Leptosphaeria maculans TaxID=5022 RepID=UPI0033213776|nr:hypothetical protein IAQ61_000430 [Plenodomus lingam]